MDFGSPMSLAFSGSRCDVIDKLCAQQLEVGRQAGRLADRLLVTNSVHGSNSRVEFNTQQQTPNKKLRKN